jgi:hypothetical protein
MNFMYPPTNRQAERLIGDVEFEERTSRQISKRIDETLREQ